MSKNHDNRRKTHVAQLAKQIQKKSESGETDSKEESGLVNQYRIIRDDLMKLRDDLTKGYDMAKDAVEKKTFINELMKLRGNF